MYKRQGVAYVYNYGGDFESRCNKGLILIEEMTNADDIAELKTMIENHLKYTGSKSCLLYTSGNIKKIFPGSRQGKVV